MYDSFDNMYQATIGIDFLSKVSKARDGRHAGPKLMLEADDVPGRQNRAATAVGYSRAREISKFDPFIHQRFQCSSGGLRHFKYASPSYVNITLLIPSQTQNHSRIRGNGSMMYVVNEETTL